MNNVPMQTILKRAVELGYFPCPLRDTGAVAVELRTYAPSVEFASALAYLVEKRAISSVRLSKNGALRYVLSLRKYRVILKRLMLIPILSTQADMSLKPGLREITSRI